MRALSALALALAACSGGPAASAPTPTPEPAPAAPPRPAPLVAGRLVSTRAAFDLVATGDGAVLAWGAPLEDGGGVRAIAMDGLGVGRGDEVIVAPAEADPSSADEVAATSASSRVAIAWIVRRGMSPRAQATVSSSGVDGFAPVADLGPSVALGIDGAGRGRVVAWAMPDGTPVVGHRLEPGPCRASGGTCARFRRSRLDGRSARGDDPMEVADPCEPLLVGAISHGQAWFHGICHGGDRPATTLYAIDPAGAPLASAPEVLAGCTPLGIAPGVTGALGVARCGDGLAMQEIGPRGDVVVDLRNATSEAICENGRPVIAIRGEGGTLRVPLAESMSRIEALLPEDVAPPGSRAVWTGEAVLVATIVSREVALRRYQCELQRLVRSYF
jgi:hypothetical protein